MLCVDLFLGSVLHPGAENELLLSAVLRSAETIWKKKKANLILSTAWGMAEHTARLIP